MKVLFTKMHGLGNDYIYIDRIRNKYLNLTNDILPRISRYLSNRHFGIGADGIILIESSKIADFKMRIFNSDGSEAQMCGNGIRCLAKYVYDSKLTTKEVFSIETLAGIKEVKVLKNKEGLVEEVEVNMGKAKVEKDLRLNVSNTIITLTKVDIGNPHAVIFIRNLDNLDIEKYGPIIENNNNFPNRTNVEFVEILDRNLIKLRVWERGSKETYACGTGACAAVATCVYKNLCDKNVKVLLKGGELNISYKKDDIYMRGIATNVFSGIIDIEKFYYNS